MLKIFKCGGKVYRELQNTALLRRSFLSEAYRCEEAWKARLQTPLLQKYEPQDLFMMIDQKYVTAGKVNAIDIDIFVNSITNEEQVEELLVLLQNLRRTAETTNTLDSTHHAVVRYLLDNNYTTELMKILYDRLTYGIIPDNLTYNILMDTYIKKKDYASAAKIAALPMLQEDTDNRITNALSIYSCFKYLENPDTWQEPPKPVDDSKEEIKVRVAYLRNPYFDDHFDLTNPLDLVGKTLAFQGKAMANVLGRTCQLRGLILYKKYQDVLKLIKQWIDKVEGNLVFEEVFNLIEKDKAYLTNDENQTKEQFAELDSVMSEVNALKQKSLCTDNLMETLEKNIKSAIDEQQESDISEQVQKYSNWERNREVLLNKQLEEINRLTRIENINKIKKELVERERLITFFENEEKIELEIEKIEKEEKEEMDRVLKLPKGEKKLKQLEDAEDYRPPTI